MCFFLGGRLVECIVSLYSFFNLVATSAIVAAQLIRAYDLMTADEDDYGDAVEAYAPTQTYNPILQYFYQCVQHRAVKVRDSIFCLSMCVRWLADLGIVSPPPLPPLLVLRPPVHASV